MDPVIVTEVALACWLFLLIVNGFLLSIYKRKSDGKGSNTFYGSKMLMFRLVATLISILHIFLEIVSAYVPLCTPWIRISDNLQCFSTLFVRLFYLERARKCYSGTASLHNIFAWAGGFLITLYIKSLALMNALGSDEECDFSYPQSLLYYMAAENAVYDIIITSVTLYPLIKHDMEASVTYGSSATKINQISKEIAFINIMNLCVFFFLVGIANTIAREHQVSIMMVINNFWFMLSTWYGPLILSTREILSYFFPAIS